MERLLRAVTAKCDRTLRSQEMRLFANAAAWHASLYWPDEDFGCQPKQSSSDLPSGNKARQLFVEQGCLEPEKLMRIILPLP